MKFNIPEDALSIVLFVGKDKKFNIDDQIAYYREERHYRETDIKYNERLNEIRNLKRDITKVTQDQSGEEQMDNLKYLIEIPISVWNEDEYTPEKLYKNELLPEKVINESELMKEFINSYEMQHLSYGWVETSRSAYFSKLTTDDFSVKRRPLWLDISVCTYEISKRHQFAGLILEGWRENAIKRKIQQEKEEEAYNKQHKNRYEENEPIIASGPMKRTDGGTTFAYPVQILVATKTKPPLAPRGVKSGFPKT